MPEKKFVIGWTGTHSTMRYLEYVIPVIKKLENEFNHLEFQVIADVKPQYSLSSLVYVPWSKDKEVDDLARFTVGIMPLQNDRWSEGKCGFKALQYLSLGIPALVSPVGVNTSIIQNDIKGFLCEDLVHWENTLRQLILSPEKVVSMALSCRQTIIDHYSVEAIKHDFLNLFD